MYRESTAMGQKVYPGGNYSTLFHKNDPFLTKGSFQKYETIQNNGGFNQLATIGGAPYEVR